jgi:hypothetical protein
MTYSYIPSYANLQDWHPVARMIAAATQATQSHATVALCDDVSFKKEESHCDQCCYR